MSTVHAPSNEFSVFLPFTKVAQQADGTLLVHTVINDETVDDQGEIVDFDAVEAATPEFMKWANVREMHDPHTASGTVMEITSDRATRTHEGVLHVVDAGAVAKVNSGVYKGTSLGGRKLAPPKLEKAAGGQTVGRLTAIDWQELSLVDRPSRASAVLTLLKRASTATVQAEALAIMAKASEGSDMGDRVDPVQDDATATPATPEAGDATPALTEAAAGTEGTDAPSSAPDVPAAAEPAPVAAPVAELPTQADAGAETAKAAAAGDMAKAAAGDLVDVHIAKERIASMIERETAEGDSETVAALQVALGALNDAEASEQTELATPENASELQAEEASYDMAFCYASVISDLAKRSVAHLQLAKAGKRNSNSDQKTIDQIHDLAVAAGAYPDAHGAADEGDTAKATDAGDLAKAGTGVDPEHVAAIIMERLLVAAPFAKAADMEAMKVELGNQLQKIAAQPMPGGPVRFADTDRHAAAPAPTAVDLSALLAKVSDPQVRDQLGRALATEAIKGLHEQG